MHATPVAQPLRLQRHYTQRRGTPAWNAVYVAHGTRWGNPRRVLRDGSGWAVRDDSGIVGTFASRNEARQLAVVAYRAHLAAHPEVIEAARRELAGRNLMCWCPLPRPGEADHCHAAVLLDVAAGEAP